MIPLQVKCGSILLSRVVMKESIICLGLVQEMKYARLPKVILVDQPKNSTG
jgi:hypothetical protein